MATEEEPELTFAQSLSESTATNETMPSESNPETN